VADADGRPGTPAPERVSAAPGRDVLDEHASRGWSAPLLRGAGVARLRQATATSAGGIVIRFEGSSPQLVVGKRLRERDGVTWTLPKGTPHADETTEQTALREVGEESGLEVDIVRPFESIAYTFVQGRTRIHKTVHYFLMVPTGGDLAQHDHEFDEVRWIGFDEAATLLTFETERTLVARAGSVATDGTFPGTGTTTRLTPP
jgi:8-oxo-dGTP pyrophosphatase MutT (NUDIX family)